MKEELKSLIDRRFLDEILSTEREYIELSFEDKGELSLYESKIGGFGYLPKSMRYPKNNLGQPLSLLIQINFSQMPLLENYPSEGILAIYVDYNNENFGIDFEKPNNQNGFRVLFFEHILKEKIALSQQIREFNNIDIKTFHPVIKGEYKIYGEKKKQYLINDTTEANLIYGMPWKRKLEEITNGNKKNQEKIKELAKKNRNQIGGYPYFSQWDPREKGIEMIHNALLIQISNLELDGEKIINWGKEGIGNFFINGQDLVNKNFFNVLYNWDCK